MVFRNGYPDAIPADCSRTPPHRPAAPHHRPAAARPAGPGRGQQETEHRREAKHQAELPLGQAHPGSNLDRDAGWGLSDRSLWHDHGHSFNCRNPQPGNRCPAPMFTPPLPAMPGIPVPARSSTWRSSPSGRCRSIRCTGYHTRPAHRPETRHRWSCRARHRS